MAPRACAVVFLVVGAALALKMKVFPTNAPPGHALFTSNRENKNKESMQSAGWAEQSEITQLEDETKEEAPSKMNLVKDSLAPAETAGDAVVDIIRKGGCTGWECAKDAGHIAEGLGGVCVAASVALPLVGTLACGAVALGGHLWSHWAEGEENDAKEKAQARLAQQRHDEVVGKLGGLRDEVVGKLGGLKDDVGINHKETMQFLRIMQQDLEQGFADMEADFKDIRSAMQKQTRSITAAVKDIIHNEFMKEKADEYLDACEEVIGNYNTLVQTGFVSLDVVQVGTPDLQHYEFLFSGSHFERLLDELVRLEQWDLVEKLSAVVFMARTVVYFFRQLDLYKSGPLLGARLVRTFAPKLIDDLISFRAVSTYASFVHCVAWAGRDTIQESILDMPCNASGFFRSPMSLNGTPWTRRASGHLAELPRDAKYLNFTGNTQISGSLKDMPKAAYLIFPDARHITGDLSALAPSSQISQLHKEFEQKKLERDTLAKYKADLKAVNAEIQELSLRMKENPLAEILHMDFHHNSDITGHTLDIPRSVVFADFHENEHITGYFPMLPPKMLHLDFHKNENIMGDIADLPATMTYLDVATSKHIIGNLSELPKALKGATPYMAPIGCQLDTARWPQCRIYIEASEGEFCPAGTRQVMDETECYTTALEALTRGGSLAANFSGPKTDRHGDDLGCFRWRSGSQTYNPNICHVTAGLPILNAQRP